MVACKVKCLEGMDFRGHNSRVPGVACSPDNEQQPPLCLAAPVIVDDPRGRQTQTVSCTPQIRCAAHTVTRTPVNRSRILHSCPHTPRTRYSPWTRYTSRIRYIPHTQYNRQIRCNSWLVLRF